MKIDGSFKSLIQGVSQQPQRDRLPGQCELMENALVKPINGLTDRPPFIHLSNIETIPDDASWHSYERGDGETFIIAAYNFGAVPRISAWDWEGTPITVYGDVTSYLAPFTNRTNTSFFTVGDYTYLINKDKVVEEKTTDSGEGNSYGAVWVRSHAFGRKVSVNFLNANGVGGTCSYTAPDGSVSSSGGDTDTDKANQKFNDPAYIIFRMYKAITGSSTGYPAEWTDVVHAEATCTFSGSTSSSHVRDYDGSVMILNASSISVEGSGINDEIIGIMDDVKEVGHLPPKSYDGHRVKVSRAEDGEDAYYLEFNSNNHVANAGNLDTADGTWNECRAYGISPGFKADTMPHALISDGTSLTFIEMQWQDRDAGDDDSNPMPPWVGKTINGIGQYQDRLYIYADEFLSFSKITLYDDMFIGSAANPVDDDGFYVTSASSNINIIRHIVEVNMDLVAFSVNAQFIIDGSQGIAASSCALVFSTEFNTNINVEPMANGNFIYFAYNSGSYCGIREYHTDSITDTNDATPITSHVDEYIPKEPIRLVPSNQENMLVVLPSSGDVDLFVYQHQTAEDGSRSQSAWHQWVIAGDDISVVYGWFDDTKLYLLVRPDDGSTVLGYIDMEDKTTEDVPYNPRLDYRKTTDIIEYNDRYGVVWPGTVGTSYDPDDFTHVYGSGTTYAGMNAVPDELVWDEDTQRLILFYEHDPVLIDGADSYTMFYGVIYKWMFIPSRPFVRGTDGVPMSSDRVTIQSYTPSIEETGAYNTLIRSDVYGEYDIEFDGKLVSQLSSVTGEFNLFTGEVPQMIGMRTNMFEVEYYKEDPRPVRFTDLEFIGSYTRRGERI